MSRKIRTATLSMSTSTSVRALYLCIVGARDARENGGTQTMLRSFLIILCYALSASAGALFSSSLPFQPAGYSTLLFEMYGTSPGLVKSLDLSHFREGLAAALAVDVGAISLGKTKPAHVAGHGMLLPVKVAQPNARKAPAALSRAVERVGFTESLVGELKRKGFVMRTPDIHVVEPGATFVPLSSCGAALSCARCAQQGPKIGASGGCSWCASEHRCLDSDTGICNRDEWDTRKCVVDKAATTIAVDESAEAQGRRERAPSATKQVSAVFALVWSIIVSCTDACAILTPWVSGSPDASSLASPI